VYKLVFIIFVVFCALAASLFTSFVGYHDKAVRFEANIEKLHQSSQSMLSNGTLTILDKAKIQQNYAKDFKEVLEKSIGARSQSESGLVMKWVKEMNPTLNSQVYLDLSSYIEGMRRDFHLSQNRLMDACASYEIARKSAISGLFMKMNGFPTIDLNKRCTVLSDSITNEAFETGIQKPLL